MPAGLARLAQLHCIEPGYHDIWGTWRAATEATQRALLAALGVDAHDDAAVARALEDAERAQRLRVVPPVTVLRRAELERGVRVQLPEAALARSLAWRLVEEGGDVHEDRLDPLAMPALETFQADGATVRVFALALAADLPDGYHRLALVQEGATLGEGWLVVAPERCYLPPALAEGARLWGAALQLYAVRSSRNAGIGDFTDLRHAVETWGERGAALVGTNPLHAISLRDPAAASPYSPSSRLFLNPAYLDIEAIDDFAELASADPALVARWRAECGALREGDSVDYPRVCAAKRALLETLYAHFERRHLAAATSRARLFGQFRAARGAALRQYALHEALSEFHRVPWREWPAAHRDPQSEDTRRFGREHAGPVGLHEYAQWQADLQLGRAQERCRDLGMAVGLYADLAVSIGPDGSEAWANQDLYALGASVGAPPDEFNTRGQDWGLPPVMPERLRDAAYAPFIATLRANMRHAGAIRIDHVMGLARLWWVPSGMSPADGAYVRYPVDDLLGIVALESHRQRCFVIGEDLGTVPEELRARLGPEEVLSYRLLLFEREGAAFKPPADYPRRALVAWSTHDLPTFTGWWQEEDLRTRERLGIDDPAQRESQQAERSGARSALVAALAREGLLRSDAATAGPPGPELALAVQQFLARTPAAVMLVQMEDVLEVAEQANLPGTVDEHPNWRRRLPASLESWPRDARLRRLARALCAIRGKSRARRERPAGLERARIPRATYRLQLHGEFTFRDATALVPYLARLGVSHVYCSPYLRARAGSRHGYDIIDHDTLNPEIGTRADFDAFVTALKAHGMAQMMDIVPNHMGVLAADNAWWQDLVENGPASPLADFFDVDWRPAAEQVSHRVLLPILGNHYGVELAAGHLVLGYEAATGTFAVRYHAHRLPLDPQQYPRILHSAVRELEAAGPALAHQAQALGSVSDAFARLPRHDERRRSRIDQRTLDKEVARGRLASLARSSAEVARAIEHAVAALNGRADDAASFDALHALLEAQAFRVAYWRVASDEINYRRFFDINDLAALRQENAAVFDATHRLVLALVNEGAVEALRIDHPDGLYDPKAYFRRLFEGCNRAVYVVIEKITAPFENVPQDWAVHGTTGYRFANVVNGIFVDAGAEARLTRAYQQFIGDETSFEEIARRSRRLVLHTALSSELTVLASRLARIARAERSTRDFTFNTLREGLVEVIAAFPVYRTYIDDEVHPEDRRYIDWAIARARSGSRATDTDVFDFIRDALTCELPAQSPVLAATVRDFARKFQQLSAPVMAKGVEDTAFYVYNRLASLNDVGGDPLEFGFPPAKFHRASAHRARHWPHTMLATSTHDNKRSEDVRARIDVISELAGGWRLQLRKWRRINAARKAIVDGAPAPSRNDEYLLYQVLLGSFPVPAPRGAALEEYRDRIVAYMRKAGREAKAHTSWARVNEPYEVASAQFIHALLEERAGNAFIENFRSALEPVAWAGYLNSLAMSAVKYTSPGVPDCYQGNELLDFSLVDPDNRRPVDYAVRMRALDALHALELSGENAPAVLRDLFTRVEGGRAKLYVTWRILQLRAAREALFTHGGYSPVRSQGGQARHVLAFARRHGAEAAVTVVARLTAALGVKPGELPCGQAVWSDTRIDLPFLAAGTLLRDAVSGRELRVDGGGLAMAEVLAHAPAAVLVL